MNNVRILFLAVLDEMYKYKENLDKDITNFGISLENLRIHLSTITISDEEKYKFCMDFREYILELKKLLDELGRQKRFLYGNRQISIISYNTTILNNIFNYLTFYANLRNIVTTTFNEFMKGITYFQTNSSVSRPIYHRDQSCGPNNANTIYKKNNLNCEINIDNDELIRRRTNSKNCYIERLVYDKLWVHFMSQPQNIGHGNELLNTDYEYFATISIDIKYDNHFPSKLIITFTNPIKIIIESYSKNIISYKPIIYNNVNDCERIIFDKENNIKIKENKQQNFDNIQLWINQSYEQIGGKKSKKIYTSTKGKYIILNKKRFYIKIIEKHI